VIKEVLCGRVCEPPADPARAGALAAMVVSQLAHRLFLDAADVRIVEFVRQLHQQTAADPHLLDAVLRGLLGGPLPAVNNPLPPLLVLGRGLVVALDMDEQEVAELVARAERQLPAWLPSSAAAPQAKPFTASSPGSQQRSQSIRPLSGAVPAEPRNVGPPSGAARTAPPHVGPPSPAGRRRLKTPYAVAAAIVSAAINVLALVVMASLSPPWSGNGANPAPTTSAPLQSGPRKVAHAFAEALNKGRFGQAREMLCTGANVNTREVAEGSVRINRITVETVIERDSTANFVAKGAAEPVEGPLVWQGTLHKEVDEWCVYDIRPGDPPLELSETREEAFAKMRAFIALVNQRDQSGAMAYVCPTWEAETSIEPMIMSAAATEAQLDVKPDPGPKRAAKYTGSVTGRSQLIGQGLAGSIELRLARTGKFCVSFFQFNYQ